MSKERTLSEKEWQGYCAYKHIEKEIKGCLDRERDYKQQLKEKDEEIKNYKISEKFMQDAIDDMCRQVDANCYDDFDDCLKELIDNKLKTNTKQVCEKIRMNCWCGGAILEDDYYKVPVKFLYQIEKGDKNA